jgi:hypothetical protein
MRSAAVLRMGGARSILRPKSVAVRPQAGWATGPRFRGGHVGTRKNPWVAALAEVVAALRSDPVLLIPAVVIVLAMLIVAIGVWMRL